MFNPLDYPLCFEKPQRLTDVVSWHEHIPFAFTIMQILKPKIFVELGTHKGDSYCAFCQTVDRLKLDTKCYAIDTWKGDRHSGLYDSEILIELRKYHDHLYGYFSRLIQCTFDQAIDYFLDNSIDLLHIDGLHTYEAARHDFEKWLPKMNDRGIILLHDINVREREFGVWKLWEELKNKYVNFEFRHGHGLGIIIIGSKVPDDVLRFLDKKDEIIISKFFSELGNRIVLGHKLEKINIQLSDKDDKVSILTNRINISESNIKTLESDLQSKDSKIKTLESDLRSKDTKIKTLESDLRSKDTKIKTLESDLQSKDTKIKTLESDLQSKDTKIKTLESNIRFKEDEIRSINESITWKTVNRYHNIMERLLPNGTNRRNYYDTFFYGIRGLVNKGEEKEKSLEIKKIKDIKHHRQIFEFPKKDIKKIETIKYPNRKEIIDFNIETIIPKTFNNPLKVSIIILNHNGAEHLNRCLGAINHNTTYKNFEVIIVDNASNDNSLDIVNKFQSDLDIKIIRNAKNETFSRGNNIGARHAKGEYLVFLNNDTEPLKGWLCELVDTIEKNKDIGIVGSKLIYPERPNIDNKGDLIFPDFSIQHMGISFNQEEEFIRPINLGKNINPLAKESCIPAYRAACSAACLLIKKDIFLQIGGFDEQYEFGYEDVDLCLRLFEMRLGTYYCPTSMLFHHEFGSQNIDSREEKRIRRQKNMTIFKNKWERKLRKWILEDKICEDHIFSEKPLRIALAITEFSETTAAGDYYTATEFGKELEKLGYSVCYIARRPNEEKWYDIPSDIDILMILLHDYDLRKIRCTKRDIIKIAWIRNWLPKWISAPWFEEYDLVMASSKISLDAVKEKGKYCNILRIATNPERFKPGSINSKYQCDYSFTGSYWNDKREIVDLLEPIPDHKFVLVGKNWEKVRRFTPYWKGFMRYDELPILYNSSKIVIDDANSVTKPIGSVNSRVFDALACGTLVITNNVIGSDEIFNGLLPTYSNKDELRNKIRFFIENPDERTKLVTKLKDVVLTNHTYAHRVKEFKNSILSFIKRKKICIKIPVPRWSEANSWGDYHMANALKKYFERNGYYTLIQILPEWENDIDYDFDVVFVLRGLSRYKPKPYHLNIMWNISHPEKVSIEEYNEYDIIFIASEKYSEQLKEQVNKPVIPLLQCTDHELFFHKFDEQYRHELLFVGNSRKVMRKIISDVLPTKYDLVVYGDMWKGLIDEKYVKGTYFPNENLNLLYSSCKILLNDHWEDMKKLGFISNRIFDALACGSFIMSDGITGLKEALNDSIVTYSDKEDLRTKIEYYMSHPDIRQKIARQGMELVLQKHTFEYRVRIILGCIESIKKKL